MATYSQADGTKILNFSMSNTNGLGAGYYWTVFTVPPGETYRVIRASFTNNYGWGGSTVQSVSGWSPPNSTESSILYPAMSNAYYYQWENAANTSDVGKYPKIYTPGQTIMLEGMQTGYQYSYSYWVIATVHNG